MARRSIAETPFPQVYPLLVQKLECRGRTRTPARGARPVTGW